MHTKDLAYTQCLNQNTINVHSVVKNMIRKCMLISRGSISYLELIFDGTRDMSLMEIFIFSVQMLVNSGIKFGGNRTNHRHLI